MSEASTAFERFGESMAAAMAEARKTMQTVLMGHTQHLDGNGFPRCECGQVFDTTADWAAHVTNKLMGDFGPDEQL